MTPKGLKMLERLIERIAMPAGVFDRVRTLSSMEMPELLEIARKYEKV